MPRDAVPRHQLILRQFLSKLPQPHFWQKRSLISKSDRVCNILHALIAGGRSIAGDPRLSNGHVVHRLARPARLSCQLSIPLDPVTVCAIRT